MTSSPLATEQILLDEQGTLGRITLNRPKTLNSLTSEMVRVVLAALDSWRANDRIQAVLIEGAGERGLCAGGDVRAIYDAAKAGDEALSSGFWVDEYRMNAALARYPKPVIGIMDGICMGGGVGISAHGSHRVVTERSKVGMPEVGIGFVPDVGGTYLLSHAPGETGTYMALTGSPVGAGDALHSGLADYYVPSDRLEDLASLLSSSPADEALSKVAEPASTAPGATFEAGAREWIDAAFSAGNVEEILRRLRERSEEQARVAAETIESKSPTSLKVTLRALRSRPSSVEKALHQEFQVAIACVKLGDFLEGVRATLVDKDRNPQWSPKRLEEVDDALVGKFFEPLGNVEFTL